MTQATRRPTPHPIGENGKDAGFRDAGMEEKMFNSRQAAKTLRYNKSGSAPPVQGEMTGHQSVLAKCNNIT
jgi:hypothetical protein